MRYQLVKSVECSNGGCYFSKYTIGSVYPGYENFKSVNDVMTHLNEYNKSDVLCKCKVEVKEIDQ